MAESIKEFLSAGLKQLDLSTSQSELELVIENLSVDEDEYNQVLSWIVDKQQQCQAKVSRVSLTEVLKGEWELNEESGDVVHNSGGFFRIIGVDVSTDQRESGRGWKQPMLDQGTESSIAGFICQYQGDHRRYLVEAKFEPGNYGRVLISPSIQVTFSNLDRAHGGRKPRFSEFFDGSDSGVSCLYSQWLPEDGGRFYLKRVKYMIVEIPDNTKIEIDDNFRWVGVRTLKSLLRVDNLINPHVRSLLAVL